MAEQTVCSLAAITLTRRVNLLRTVVALVACWPRASGIVTLVDLGVRITQLDGTLKTIQGQRLTFKIQSKEGLLHVTLQLVLESDGLNL